MDVKSDDDEVETKLDLEFRRILRIIKIYVPCIMNIDFLTSYRLWLEKLSEAAQTDKHERNRYLIELCRQIQDGILEKPFRQRPIPGPLPPLRRNLSNNKEQLQQHQQQQKQQQQQQQQRLHQQHQEQLQQQQLLQLQQQQLQQKQLQQQQQQQKQQLLQLQQQQLQLQQQEQQQKLQKQHFFEDVIPVKQESVQNTIAKEVNRANKASTSKQEVPTYQHDLQYQNYSKTFSKTSHNVQKDPKVIKDDVQKPKLIVLKKPPPLELPNSSPKKRNQHTVLKEIQEHIRNSNKYQEEKGVLAELASKFPEPPKQLSTHTEVLPSYVNTRQYVETQQRYIIPNDCCLPEKQQQNVSYQQQEPRPPYAMYTKHPEDSFSATQELLKIAPQQQKSAAINFRMNEDIEEESSWYDLSDVSRTATASRMESGDSANSLIPRLTPHPIESNNSIDPSKIHEMCESKIKDLVNIVAELKRQNISLHTKAEVIIQNLSDEVSLLKLKEQKLNDMKKNIKQTHSVASAQWKSTVTELKQTLRNAQDEIETLQNEIVGLKDKLEEFSAQKQQDNVTIRQRLADMYDKEIEMLKQNYVRHIVDIENKFTQILIEKEAAFNQKFNDLKELYDTKIAEITKGISEISTDCFNKGLGRNMIPKRTFISKNVLEKQPLEKMERTGDEKRPWRKRIAVGSYKLNNS